MKKEKKEYFFSAKEDSGYKYCPIYGFKVELDDCIGDCEKCLEQNEPSEYYSD